MKPAKEQQKWVESLVKGEISMHALPADWEEIERVAVRKEAVRLLSGLAEEDEITPQQVWESAKGKNCENMIGITGVPLGVVGPIKFEEEEKTIFVPLATTEGALVASVQRGVKAWSKATKQDFLIEDRGMTRAPVFVVDSLAQGKEIMEWLKEEANFQQLAAMAQSTSKHIKLVKAMTKLVGKNLFVKFFYDTQAAMGMNMVTIASSTIAHFMQEKFKISCAALSGNGCVDKKPSWGTVLEGRGMYVQAEAVVPGEAIKTVLKTTPEKIAEVVMRKNFVGGASFGSMGFNAHFANIVAAVYLATGQDMGHVVEGSVGITTAETVAEGLYFSVTLPNLLVGVVGGGTNLPHQRRALDLMGVGTTKEDKYRLARNIACVVWGGELSLLSALASDDLACAHQSLGRGNKAIFNRKIAK